MPSILLSLAAPQNVPQNVHPLISVNCQQGHSDKEKEICLRYRVLFTCLPAGTLIQPIPRKNYTWTWRTANKEKLLNFHLWPSTATRSEKTTLVFWYGKALVALHCSRVFQSCSKAVVYQPQLKAPVSLAAYTAESYLAFLQLCTQHNLPHAPLSPLSKSVTTSVKGPWKWFPAPLCVQLTVK